jgi:hypothetical protein
MTLRIRHISAGLALLCSAGLSQAAPQQLSSAELDAVAAGQLAYPSLSNFNSTGAVAFATSNAVATPAGTAVIDARITTNVGLKSIGFTDSIKAAVIR